MARARSDALPPSRRMGIWPAARKNQAVFHESKYSALATKVTRRRITSGRNKESQNDTWLGGHDHGAGRRDVLPALHVHPPQQAEDGGEQDFSTQ